MVEDLVEFLKLPWVSQCHPGESVSVGYGKRRVRYKLNMSKEAIIKEFVSTKALNFCIKTLLKYWPLNFVTPCSHNRERNMCPIQSLPQLL